MKPKFSKGDKLKHKKNEIIILEYNKDMDIYIYNWDGHKRKMDREKIEKECILIQTGVSI